MVRVPRLLDKFLSAGLRKRFRRLRSFAYFWLTINWFSRNFLRSSRIGQLLYISGLITEWKFLDIVTFWSIALTPISWTKVKHQNKNLSLAQKSIKKWLLNRKGRRYCAGCREETTVSVVHIRTCKVVCATYLRSNSEARAWKRQPGTFGVADHHTNCGRFPQRSKLKKGFPLRWYLTWNQRRI